MRLSRARFLIVSILFDSLPFRFDSQRDIPNSLPNIWVAIGLYGVIMYETQKPLSHAVSRLFCY